jgi:lipopolysaccharide transport system ATP-binding protein
MSDTVIKVENLSKKYMIRHQQAQQYTALRDVIADGFKSVGRRLSGAKQDPAMGSTQEEFWALKDVSFEVKQGDRVGIIGRNGAGKSTLLKILSRIVEPTIGEITLNGRVASLLEVGTGFHPELTGRENVYLNGAILGMGKVEIKKKFDGIVDFAEVAKFIDMPVKHYSSGMYVRLAFAVAAYLEPEILIVDEVLAVGDTAFQKKCLGKMEDVADKEGRTVLFVSHNMGAMNQLCNKGIYLLGGKIEGIGQIDQTITKYLNNLQVKKNIQKLFTESNTKDKKSFFRGIDIINHEGLKTTNLSVKYPFFIKLEYENKKDLPELEITVRIDTNEGQVVLSSHQSNVFEYHSRNTQKGIYTVFIKVPQLFLMPNTYLLTVGSHKPMVEVFDLHESIISFTINETGSMYSRYGQDKQRGMIIPHFQWYESINT